MLDFARRSIYRLHGIPIAHPKGDFWKMKKLLVFLFSITIGFQSFSQNEFETLFKQGQEASSDGKYLMAILRFKKAKELQPLNETIYLQLSWNYLLMKNFSEATKHAKKAFYLNQSNSTCHTILAYAQLAKGEAGAEALLQTAIGLSKAEEKEYFLLDFQDMRAAGLNESVFSDEKIDNYFSQKQNWNNDVDWLFASITSFYDGKVSMDQIVNKLNSISIPATFKGYYVKLFSDVLVQGGYNDAAKSLISVGRNIETEDPITRRYLQTSLIVNLMRISNYAGDFEQAIKYYEEVDLKGWEVLESITLSHPLKESWTLASQAFNAFGSIDEQEEVAKKLIAASGTYQDPWYQANGYNSMGMVKLNSNISSDRSAARSNLETALSMAQSNDFEGLIPSIVGNLAISYWQHGMQDEAKKAYVKLSDDAIARENYLDAELYLNNLASLYFFNEDYRNAANYFQKSIDIIERFRDTIADDAKITFLQARQSSYTFLSSCLVKLGDKKGLFKAQEAQRARMLADQLKGTSLPATLDLPGFQSTLSEDQAAIYYTLMEAGAVVIHVITATESYAIRHEVFDEFIAFKNKYLQRMKSSYTSREGFKPALANRMEGGVQIQESDKALLINSEDFEMMIQFSRELLQKENTVYEPIRKDFLALLHSFLIAPIQSKIQSKSKLLISPDGLLNFIPFETLTNSAGNYLVQTHEVSYIQSGEVYRSLLNRSYPANRKGMLAFGGAIYEEMNVLSNPIRGSRRLNEVKLNVDQKLNSGASLRDEYAAIGFGKMNYLPGTLAEVNGLSTIVPNSTVYLGEEFEESFIKQLSSSGEMSTYKVVHFATHGFSLPMVPELSGIATCIFADEKNGEDGYLNVGELSRLNLKADLAVLSACETGLGKIYGGEGVFGLTQALLIAGANEAAVSLWPVSDQGTMYFMRGMYELVEKKKLTYSEAMTEMKKQFIAGKFGQQFKHPNYWAPFIHYGKTTKANVQVVAKPLVVQATSDPASNGSGVALHENGISRMVVSYDGERIATGGNDDRVIVWDAKILKPIKELPFKDELKGLHFNENGTSIYVYSGYNELIKHDLESGAVTTILPKGKGDVTNTRVWSAGKEITVFKNHIIEFMDLETGKVLSKMDFGESGYVASFVNLPEEDRFILSFVTWGHKDDRIEVYKRSTKELLQTFKMEAVNIYYDKQENAVFAVRARGNYAAQKIKLATGEIEQLDVAKGSLLVLMDGKFLTNKHPMINEEGLHQIHDMKTGEQLAEIELKGFEHPKKLIADGQLLMMDGSGLLRVLDITAGKFIK